MNSGIVFKIMDKQPLDIEVANLDGKILSETSTVIERGECTETITSKTSSLYISVSHSPPPHLASKFKPHETKTSNLQEASNRLAVRNNPKSHICKRRRSPIRQRVAPRKFCTVPAEDEPFTFISDQAASLLLHLSKKHGMPRLFDAFLQNEMRKNVQSNPEVLTYKPPSTDQQGIMYSQSAVDCTAENYVCRWETFGGCDKATLLHALVYMRRVQRKNAGLPIVPATMHRMFAIAVIVAAKFVQDAVYPMTYYRLVSGVPTIKELLRLELLFLQFVRYELYVSPEELSELVYELKSIVEEGNIKKNRN